MRQSTCTEAGTLSGLLSYGTYGLDFSLNGTLYAGITRPECHWLKCMELTHLSANSTVYSTVQCTAQYKVSTVIKGLNSPRNYFFLGKFCLTEHYFLVLVFLTPFNNLFTQTSRSPMSRLFRFSKYLGKSNGKKSCQI